MLELTSAPFGYLLSNIPLGFVSEIYVKTTEKADHLVLVDIFRYKIVLYWVHFRNIQMVYKDINLKQGLRVIIIIIYLFIRYIFYPPQRRLRVAYNKRQSKWPNFSLPPLKISVFIYGLLIIKFFPHYFLECWSQVWSKSSHICWHLGNWLQWAWISSSLNSTVKGFIAAFRKQEKNF